ncbi:MAG: type I methionyl aminopeptidase [Planctomycetota bacterium]|nr:type I methionyl aminopeptidase [Planctomycetota bacterium]
MVVTAQPDIQGATLAARRVVQTHEALVDFLKTGQTLAQVDEFVAETLKKLDCRSAFLRYRIPGHPPFPSHSFLSINDCIVHGTQDLIDDPLKPGDIFSIDIGVIHKGWVGDAAWTYAIEHASDEARALMDCGKESLRLGIEAIKPGRPLIDWAKAVQGHVERECGFHLVRNLGGHGYGRKLHGPPFVSNVVPVNRHEWPDAFKVFEPGMLIALEPMLSTSTGETFSRSRTWPIYTTDGSLSVHHEADVMVTEDGAENLTAGLYDLPDVVG